MRYQKVETHIWNDEKFSQLSADEKYLFLYLLTSPHSNCLGAFVMKPGYASDDMGWEREQYLKSLTRLAVKGFVTVDETLCLILVNNYLRHNPPDNPNQYKAILKVLASLPKSCTLNPVILLLKSFEVRFGLPLPQGFGEPFGKPLPKGSGEPLYEPLSKPETEAETEEETETVAATTTESVVKWIGTEEKAKGAEEENNNAIPEPQERMLLSEAITMMRLNLGNLTESKFQVTTLQDFCNKYPRELITEGFTSAMVAGATSLNWVRKCLKGLEARSAPGYLSQEGPEAKREQRNAEAVRRFCEGEL